jgi:hypothetical protein
MRRRTKYFVLVAMDLFTAAINNIAIVTKMESISGINARGRGRISRLNIK